MSSVQIRPNGATVGNLTTETFTDNQAFFNAHNYFLLVDSEGNELGPEMADYVVQETTSSGFKVVRWASGWTECFKTISTSAATFDVNGGQKEKWYIDWNSGAGGSFPYAFNTGPVWMSASTTLVWGEPGPSDGGGNNPGTMWCWTASANAGSSAANANITWKGFTG